MKTPESTPDFFDRTAVRFSANYRKGEDFEERRRIWGRLTEESRHCLSGGALCLDIGCGDGSLSRPVAALGYPTVGIDQSGEMLALARRKAEEEGFSPHADYVRGSLPLSPELVDLYREKAGLVLCSSVLEYVDEYERVLSQAHEMLKTGGRLIVSVPNRDSLYRMGERILRSVLARRDSYVKYQRHQFYAGSFKSLMTRLGYRIIHEEYFALPFQKYSSRIFGGYRGRRLATLYLLVVEK